MERFKADLVLRPLLVEGMLAVRAQSDVDRTGPDWAVLVDSETHSVSQAELFEESYGRPLPVRFRNTVAHELAHSLAFRPAEFGVRFSSVVHKHTKNVIVDAIERETEKLSPLLLCTDKALLRLLSGRTQPITAGDLKSICHSIGISRYLLISRLCLLRQHDSNGLLQHVGLRNIAILLGRWVNNSHAVLRKWPLFVNFDRNIVPAFVLRLQQHDRMPANTIFDDLSSATTAEDLEHRASFMSEAGTASHPFVENMFVECTGERVIPAPGAEFCIVVQGKARFSKP